MFLSLTARYIVAHLPVNSLLAQQSAESPPPPPPPPPLSLLLRCATISLRVGYTMVPGRIPGGFRGMVVVSWPGGGVPVVMVVSWWCSGGDWIEGVVLYAKGGRRLVCLV